MVRTTGGLEMMGYDDTGLGTVLDCGGGFIGGDFWTFRNCDNLTGGDCTGTGGDLADVMELAGLIADVAEDSLG